MNRPPFVLLGIALSTLAFHSPAQQPATHAPSTNDTGRVMAIFCHNTDLGDGWEREGKSEYYFKEFSQKKAYPMGINIVVYALTH